MVQVPDALVWELVKKNTSFMKKVNGRSKRSGCVKFSVEPTNVKSISTFQCSGLANSKAVSVVFAPDNKAVLVKKTASKAHTQPAKGTSSTNVHKDFRRSEKIILSQAIDNYYRPDLKAPLLGKFTKIYQGNRRAAGTKSKVPVKKGRTSSKA
uniref:Ribosomal eL28/Mak16 domain-containing protein n=1 Tax=Grammatophora oceanica TaxID=210454 RepID=A0A7S1V3G1_9STRA|eukprot:CAMPEP_0194025946 /NCGR_PEP_ID=MMETSP0009_2-20130614/247_1 /TAXON_ID=210454 /ORGANISM="Grammatophora oceanica, Strain CCMP 410" /LENGTH=152 /DNA_ID=CAMNT_0038664359 /DNA_START=58 /DNA_END=516 /DNA_ORIENTATION=+